jgi:hypothetical protein
LRNSEDQTMSEPILVCVGLTLLFVLCLPFAGIHKLILELSAWALRVLLIALLAAAAYLWFDPARLPADVTAAFSEFPRVRVLLPDPATPYFGVTVAAVVVTALLPVLAVLDVTRRLAGSRLRRLRALTTQSEVEVVRPAPLASERPVPVLRRTDRRAAADALAGVSPRRSAVP